MKTFRNLTSSVTCFALACFSVGATAQYVAPVVKPYPAPVIRAEPARRVQPEGAPQMQSYEPTRIQREDLPTATLNTAPGRKSTFNHGIYLTIGQCNQLHCDANPGMVGVVDQFEGVAPQYAMHKLTLVVTDAATKKILENRHLYVLSNGKFSSFITGYNKPSGTYSFAVYSSDRLDELLRSGSFTVTREKKADPQAPVEQNVVGTWYGLGGGSTGSITLNADGTYTKDGQYGGRYVAAGGHVHFDGVLSGWNNGNAVTTAAHALVFHWTQNGYGVEMSYSR